MRTAGSEAFAQRSRVLDGGVAVVAIGAGRANAQRVRTPPQGAWPEVTVNDRTSRQNDFFLRNVGRPNEQTTAFTRPTVIGNVYYLATGLATHVINTPQRHILINNSCGRAAPVVQKSVEQVGFMFSDIKILLGTRAHGDHMEGDAAVKQRSGTNPFIDPAWYTMELDLVEAMFKTVLAEQAAAAPQ